MGRTSFKYTVHSVWCLLQLHVQQNTKYSCDVQNKRVKIHWTKRSKYFEKEMSTWHILFLKNTFIISQTMVELHFPLSSSLRPCILWKCWHCYQLFAIDKSSKVFTFKNMSKKSCSLLNWVDLTNMYIRSFQF